MNQLLKQIACNIFGYKIFLEKAARMPPALRTYFSYRFFSMLANQALNTGCLDTNMGISKDYHCTIPFSQHMALFGKPALYNGERGALYLAANLSQTAEAFIDIGSHIGYFIFFLRNRLPTIKPIYFFEPDRQLFSVIEKNVRCNSLANVFGYNEAIGKIIGQAKFYRNLSDSSSGSLSTMFSNRHEVIEEMVSITTFEDFCKRVSLKNACVKVDIEGAEQDFIIGSGDAITNIAYLIIEVLGPAVGEGFIRKMIKELGFHAYYINDMRLEYSTDGDFTYALGQFNWLFCRRNPAELNSLLMGSIFKIKI